MGEDGEHLRPGEIVEESAKDAAERIFETAKKMGRERKISVLDEEGNEWTYGITASEALTLIKLKKEGAVHPAIIVRQKKIGGQLITEFVVTAIDNGTLQEVFYDGNGKIKSVEDMKLQGQMDGVYKKEELPQSINTQQTWKKFREGWDQFKGELLTLVPAKSKVTPTETTGRAVQQPQPQPQPAVRKAA